MDSVSARVRPAAPCGSSVALNAVFPKEIIDLELKLTSAGPPVGAPSQEVHEFPMIL